MALDPTKLSGALFDAFSKNTVLTEPASEELKTKCDDIAAAIDAFVKSAEVIVDIPVIPVTTPTGPGTTAPSQGISSAVN